VSGSRAQRPPADQIGAASRHHLSRRRAFAYAILAVTLGVASGLAVAWGAGRALNVDLGWVMRREALRLRPPPPLGIFALDDRIGTRHIPGAIGLHETREFKVLYSIDAAGARTVPGAPRGRPIVEILGDSFTFGNGVEDRETYAARLQQSLGARVAVRNRGVMGWGTTQSMMALEDDLGRGDPIELAVYAWLPFHNQRNYRSRGWLETLAANGQRLPLFELVGPRLVFRGLAGPADGIVDGAEELRRQEWAITEAAICEMAAAMNGRLLVLMLPFRGWMGPHGLVTLDRVSAVDSYARLERILIARGIPSLDLGEVPRLAAPDLYFQNDLHPTARWHRLVAQALARAIETNAVGVAGLSAAKDR
jgi:hypothetical protein